jgi:hypothetical protein
MGLGLLGADGFKYCYQRPLVFGVGPSRTVYNAMPSYIFQASAQGRESYLASGVTRTCPVVIDLKIATTIDAAKPNKWPVIISSQCSGNNVVAIVFVGVTQK